jgi:hypothetical protein
MTDTNAKLAKAIAPHARSKLVGTDSYGWAILESLDRPGERTEIDPEDSHHDFHAHVLPELERRGLLDAWAEKVAELVDTANNTVSAITELDDEEDTALSGVTYTGLAACLSAPASVLCEAALAVMGGGE